MGLPTSTAGPLPVFTGKEENREEFKAQTSRTKTLKLGMKLRAQASLPGSTCAHSGRSGGTRGGMKEEHIPPSACQVH